MSMAVKNSTKDTVIRMTGIFLRKTELDSKKVRPRILLNYKSIAEVFEHIVGEHVMKVYSTVRGVYQVCVYLEGIMESGHFICYQELLREREENKTRTI